MPAVELFYDHAEARERQKHIDTHYHWVQKRVAQKNFRIKKGGAEDMFADVLVKSGTEERMNRAFFGMNFGFCDGQRQI